MWQVLVPATSANLGPGFDTLGCALELYNIFTFKKSDELRFIGFDEKYANENNLVYTSYAYVFNYLKKEIINVSIEVSSNIPETRGLGSSSSCVVAGIVAANQLLNNPLTTLQCLKLATEIEGHPDNVTPCLLGGLCLSDENDVIHYPVANNIHFLLLVPSFTLSTAMSRSVLPTSYSRSDCLVNINHILWLLEGMKTGNAALIRKGIVDTLHVPYRKGLIEDYDAIEQVLLNNGCCGVTISGAGPTLLAIFTEPYSIETIKEQLKHFKNNWQAIDLKLQNEGCIIKEIHE